MQQQLLIINNFKINILYIKCANKKIILRYSLITKLCKINLFYI